MRALFNTALLTILSGQNEAMNFQEKCISETDSKTAIAHWKCIMMQYFNTVQLSTNDRAIKDLNLSSHLNIDPALYDPNYYQRTRSVVQWTHGVDVKKTNKPTFLSTDKETGLRRTPPTTQQPITDHSLVNG